MSSLPSYSRFDMKNKANLFMKALQEHLKFALDALNGKISTASDLEKAVRPLKDSIEKVCGVKETARLRKYDSNLAAVNEGISSLFWVCQTEITPKDFISSFVDGSIFHLDRIIRASGSSDEIQCRWAKAVKDVFNGILLYSTKYYPNGLQPAVAKCSNENANKDVSPVTTTVNSTVSNLFNDLRNIDSASKVLKKTSGKTSGSGMKALDTQIPNKPEICKPIGTKQSNVIDGNKWTIEGFENQSFFLDTAQINHIIHVLDCSNCKIIVKPKINCLIIDNCKSITLETGPIVSQIEFTKSCSCKAYLQDVVPTLNIDQCESMEIYLSPGSLSVEVYTARSSVVNLMIPSEEDEYVEKTIPQQFKTVLKGKEIVTEGVKHVGA